MKKIIFFKFVGLLSLIFTTCELNRGTDDLIVNQFVVDNLLLLKKECAKRIDGDSSKSYLGESTTILIGSENTLLSEEADEYFKSFIGGATCYYYEKGFDYLMVINVGRRGWIASNDIVKCAEVFDIRNIIIKDELFYQFDEIEILKFEGNPF